MAPAARPSRHPTALRARRSAKPVEYNILLTATLCLLAAGAVMVYSASSGTLLAGRGDGTLYLLKYLGFGAVGLVAMLVLARSGVQLLPRIVPALLGTSFVLLVLVMVPGIGIEANGARRWLGVGPLTFQPSELMKLALVLYGAGLLATNPARLRSINGGVIGPLLVVGGAAMGLVALQPDLGTALVIAFTLGCLLLVAGTPIGLLGRMAGIGTVLVMLFIVVEPYRAARLTAFVNPWAHAHGIGFQSVQGQIALGSGGVFGVGLGESVQKFFWIPEAHTDFILAVIGEELGVAGICGLLFLYGLIAYAGLRTARAAATRHAQLLAAGLTALILCQALLNVFAVLGLAPLTGVPLPFISSGSSSLLVLLATMGLLLNIASADSSRIRAVPAEPAPQRVDARGSRGAESADRGGWDRRTRRAGAGGGRAADGRGR